MKVTADEINIRNAIHVYLKDSSQENYQKLTNLVFKEREEENNLFQALAKNSDANKQPNTIYW